MKKVYDIMSVALIVLTALTGQSCSNIYADNEYVPEGENNRNYEDYDSYPIYVTLNHNSLVYSSTVKKQEGGQEELASKGSGSGAFDMVNDPLGFDSHYENAKFYVLAFRKTVLSSGELSAQPDFSQLMYSVSNDSKRDCLLSTERENINGTTQAVGKLTKPENKGGALRLLKNVAWEDNPSTAAKEDREVEMTHYWSKTYNEVGYNFFGYYIDNAEVYGTERTTDKITLDVELNGTNDIMVGSAPEVTDSMLRVDFPNSVQEESIRKDIIKKGDGAYSTFGAVHSVEPRIDLRHCLAQLVFRANLLDDQANISVTNVEVAAERKGSLIVASRDVKEIGPTATGDKAWIGVPDGGKVIDLKYDTPVNVGSGILLPEAESYPVRIAVIEKGLKTNTGGTEEEYMSSVREGTVTFEGGFKAGVTYYVTVSVYGSTKIDLQATISPWKDGGSATVDFPDKYE